MCTPLLQHFRKVVAGVLKAPGMPVEIVIVPPGPKLLMFRQWMKNASGPRARGPLPPHMGSDGLGTMGAESGVS